MDCLARNMNLGGYSGCSQVMPKAKVFQRVFHKATVTPSVT